MKNTQFFLLGAAVLTLMAGTAVATMYVANSDEKPAPKQQQARIYHQQQPLAYAGTQPSQPACDDKNIVGTLAGGVAGGVLGNQIGSGSGRTVATVGGALGGAYLGNEYLPTRNVTCR